MQVEYNRSRPAHLNAPSDYVAQLSLLVGAFRWDWELVEPKGSPFRPHVPCRPLRGKLGWGKLQIGFSREFTRVFWRVVHGRQRTPRLTDICKKIENRMCRLGVISCQSFAFFACFFHLKKTFSQVFFIFYLFSNWGKFTFQIEVFFFSRVYFAWI